MTRKLIIMFCIILSTGIEANCSENFGSISPVNPIPQTANEQNSNENIKLSIPKKATLTKNDVANHYAIALERFVQCNVKSSYNDFRILIETIVPNDYAYLKMAEKMADLGFFNLSELALSKINDKEISGLMAEDIKNFYFPQSKLKIEDEIYLGEIFSNIIYNDQSKEALQEMSKNSELLTKSDYANYLMALGYLKADNIKDAEIYINKSISMNNNNLNYKKLKAEVMLQSKKPKNALKLISEIKKSPIYSKDFDAKISGLEQYILYKTVKNEAEKKYHLGYYYYYEGDNSKAVRTLQSGISNKKKYNEDIYALSSKIYLEQKEYEKSENNALKATKINGNNSIALTILGDLKFRDGDYKTALKYYEKSASSDKKNSDNQIKTALTFEKLGQVKQAKAIYQRVLKDFSDCDLAYYYVALNDDSRRMEYLKKALALNINLTDGWVELAKFSLDKQNYLAARHYLAIVKYIDENDFRYYYYQGRVSKAQGMMEDATYNFKKSIQLKPDFEPAKRELSI